MNIDEYDEEMLSEELDTIDIYDMLDEMDDYDNDKY